MINPKDIEVGSGSSAMNTWETDNIDPEVLVELGDGREEGETDEEVNVDE